jgi:succinate-semialdehyde dehydrogenase / glutarate-semialdehyde dehydrogenase
VTQYRSINPATEEDVASEPSLNLQDSLSLLNKSKEAFQTWSQSSFFDRARLLHSVADQLEAQLEKLATTITLEMGKTITESKSEILKSAHCARYFADHGETFLAPVSLESDARSSYVQHPPLGPLLGILPWNFPFWLAFRFLAPALMAGNSVLIKPDPHLPACSKLLLNIFKNASAPEGLLELLPIDHTTIAELIAHPDVRGVSFTGSSLAGQKVGGLAGQHIKPLVLELGGSDPAIVLADANLEAAAKAIAQSRCVNNGQSCIATKRIILEAPIHDRFIELLQKELETYTLGDPLLDSTKIGPLARRDLLDKLHQQVEATISEGATLRLGGTPLPGLGYFYPVTLLTDTTTEMTACREETFGPVAVTLKAGSLEDAISIANATEYGLAASIWTQSDRGASIAHRIEAGQVVVNGVVKTDPRLPSGGIKNSGLGRELGPQGILEFVNTQQVWLGP